jgi:hypothetical protein
MRPAISILELCITGRLKEKRMWGFAQPHVAIHPPAMTLAACARIRSGGSKRNEVAVWLVMVIPAVSVGPKS